jgi:hypothetical protein
MHIIWLFFKNTTCEHTQLYKHEHPSIRPYCTWSSTGLCFYWSLFQAFHSSFISFGWFCVGWRRGPWLSKQSLNNDNHSVVSPVDHWVILECHPLLRQLTRGLTWKDQHRVFSLRPLWVFFWQPQFGPGLLCCWVLSIRVSDQSVLQKCRLSWVSSVTCDALTLLCPKAEARGRHLKVIDFSNWNFRSNWEMRAFPIWKASAVVFFFFLL